MSKSTQLNQSPFLLYGAWIVALVATLCSLYYSEIAHLVPCILCWYQRIVLYPLVIILGVAIIARDKSVYRYVLPLSILGLLFSGYHSLIHFGLIPEPLLPCSAGVSCTTKHIVALGLTIPMCAFIAFLLITIAMYQLKKETTND